MKAKIKKIGKRENIEEYRLCAIPENRGEKKRLEKYGKYRDIDIRNGEVIESSEYIDVGVFTNEDGLQDIIGINKLNLEYFINHKDKRKSIKLDRYFK